jgi:hypothetical protein
MVCAAWVAEPEGVGTLHDGELAAEIALLGEVIAAVAVSDHALTGPEVDEVLGVPSAVGAGPPLVSLDGAGPPPPVSLDGSGPPPVSLDGAGPTPTSAHGADPARATGPGTGPGPGHSPIGGGGHRTGSARTRSARMPSEGPAG